MLYIFGRWNISCKSSPPAESIDEYKISKNVFDINNNNFLKGRGFKSSSKDEYGKEKIFLIVIAKIIVEKSMPKKP